MEKKQNIDLSQEIKSAVTINQHLVQQAIAELYGIDPELANKIQQQLSKNHIINKDLLEKIGLTQEDMLPENIPQTKEKLKHYCKQRQCFFDLYFTDIHLASYILQSLHKLSEKYALFKDIISESEKILDLNDMQNNVYNSWQTFIQNYKTQYLDEIWKDFQAASDENKNHMLTFHTSCIKDEAYYIIYWKFPDWIAETFQVYDEILVELLDVDPFDDSIDFTYELHESIYEKLMELKEKYRNDETSSNRINILLDQLQWQNIDSIDIDFDDFQEWIPTQHGAEILNHIFVAGLLVMEQRWEEAKDISDHPENIQKYYEEFGLENFTI